MHHTVSNLIAIKDLLKKKTETRKSPTIIAVSKTFRADSIIPLIDYGHIHFGENKVQETQEKWINLKLKYPEVQLHMVGKLQSNKVKFAISLFDYIHSLDNLKLAEKIANEQAKANKKLKIFIQINIGDEEQKNGIKTNELQEFSKTCIEEFNLDIIGLMCLPPKNLEPSIYFLKMKTKLEESVLNELSMGMSEDYLEATDYGSTYVRIGQKIFGKRY
jgi:PLP dependent protein